MRETTIHILYWNANQYLIIFILRDGNLESLFINEDNMNES